jgi:hypothetical protein
VAAERTVTMRKLRLWVSIAVNIAIGAAMAVLAVNQLASLYATRLELQRVADQDAATDACMLYEVPHALMVNGVIWCYTVYEGTEITATLEDIADFFGSLDT